jgi:AbrB family looped-hinge helix DNA binding protein
MSRMTTKGQVTIPKRVRDYLGLNAGSEVAFECASDGKVYLMTNEMRPKSRFAALRGTLGPGMTTDELMKLTRGWGESDYDVK